jgi:2'-5' RNA ligase
LNKSSLLVLAYPQISKTDFERIQKIRREFDGEKYQLVEPHFTFVFPVMNIISENFIQEIKRKAGGIKQLDFVIRSATVNQDDFSNYYHVFLVPDEGHSSMIRLHDKLYSGMLAPELRPDIDFIPHITVAGSNDRQICKMLADERNNSDFMISGKIKALHVVEYANEKINQLEEIKLIQ